MFNNVSITPFLGQAPDTSAYPISHTISPINSGAAQWATSQRSRSTLTGGMAAGRILGSPSQARLHNAREMWQRGQSEEPAFASSGDHEEGDLGPWSLITSEPSIDDVSVGGWLGAREDPTLKEIRSLIVTALRDDKQRPQVLSLLKPHARRALDEVWLVSHSVTTTFQPG